MGSVRLTEKDIYAVDNSEWMKAALRTAITETAEVPAWKPCNEKYGEQFLDVDTLFEYLKKLKTGSKDKTTWHNVVSRAYMDLKSNWLSQALSRFGAQKSDSLRRHELYAQRRELRNRENLEILWNKCPSRCAISGHLINYGLGENQSLIDNVCLKISGMKGLSPSIERIDPELGYTLDNIEIISAFENYGRNQGVDYVRMRKERKDIDNNKQTNNKMTIEMFEKG